MPFSAVAATTAVMLGVDDLAVVCIVRRAVRSGRIHRCWDGVELDLQVVPGGEHHTRPPRGRDRTSHASYVTAAHGEQARQSGARCMHDLFDGEEAGADAWRADSMHWREKRRVRPNGCVSGVRDKQAEWPVVTHCCILHSSRTLPHPRHIPCQ